MARPHRIRVPGLVRHVMARGNGRMKVFVDDTEFAWFVGLLGEVVQEFAFECWNYCVMPNHYHLTLRPTLGNLSEGIQRLNGLYAQWWNRRHQHVGHVFQGRFKDQIVQEDQYWLTLCRYVALNPVRAGLAARPEDWTWSSYAATVGVKPRPVFLATEPSLRIFGVGSEDLLRTRLAMHVLGPTNDSGLVNDIRSNRTILGDRAFVLSYATAGRESMRHGNRQGPERSEPGSLASASPAGLR